MGIYKFHTETAVKQLHSKIQLLKEKLKPFCAERGISFHEREEFENATAALNLNWEPMQGLFSNIGLYLNDNKGTPRFTFYTIKSYRESDKVFFKKEVLLSNATLEEIDKDLISYVEQAWQINNSWTKADLTQFS